MRWLSRQAIAIILAGLLSWPEATACRSAGVEAKPVSGPWDDGEFTFPSREKKTRRSLSGIACPNVGLAARVCLVVFDEGTQAHYVTLSSTGYTIDNIAVALRPADGELDAEGATSDEKYYYVTGSHSAKRSTCESNQASRRIIRFAFDPASGKAKRDENGRLLDYQDKDNLWHLMASHPALKDSVGEKKCLGTEPPEDAPGLKGQRGVNIEGLAASKGALHFGFRGPAKDGEAPILSVDANAIFETSDTKADVTFLRVGSGRGVRDLATIKDGILVLAGPDDDKTNENAGWSLGTWDGVPSSNPNYKEIATLVLNGVKRPKCDDEPKPEAMAVLEDSPDRFDLVIMSDGMCDGGPLRFAIPRR